MTYKQNFLSLIIFLLLQGDVFCKAFQTTSKGIIEESYSSKNKALIIVLNKNETSLLRLIQLFIKGIQTRHDKTHEIFIFKATDSNPLALENLDIAEQIATTILTLKKNNVDDIEMFSIGSGIWPAALTSQLLTLFDTELSFHQKNEFDETMHQKAIKKMDDAFKKKKSDLWNTMLNLFSPKNSSTSSMGNAPRNKKFIHSMTNARAFIKTLYVIHPTAPSIQFFFDLNTIEKMVNMYSKDKGLDAFIGSTPLTRQKNSKKIYFCKIIIDSESLCCKTCLPCKKKMNQTDKIRFMLLLGMRIKHIGFLTKDEYTTIKFSLREDDPLIID